jgi:hypothetical protein
MTTPSVLVVGIVVAMTHVAVAGGQTVESRTPSARTEVLVLGTYHMANPGLDIVNTRADDVLAPKRQREIAELVAVLKTFGPTKIAVERNPNDERLARDYANYVAGTHELTRNEIEQIGFRLAKDLGHRAVYGVDADGEFPHPRVVKYAKATGRSEEFDAIFSDIREMVKAQDAYLASHTVLEALQYMNSDARVAEGVGYYFRQAHFGEPWDWAGADLVSDWFRRNMRIFSNIVQLAHAPNERLLVIVGAGHLGWLQFAFASDPTVRLRKLGEFVR